MRCNALGSDSGSGARDSRSRCGIGRDQGNTSHRIPAKIERKNIWNHKADAAGATMQSHETRGGSNLLVLRADDDGGAAGRAAAVGMGGPDEEEKVAGA